MALAQQDLIEPDAHPADQASKEEIADQVRRLGCIQIDTIQVVQRSQYLVMWSRLGNFDPINFDQLVYHPTERILFEGWQHAACIIPLEDFRYQMPRMRQKRENPSKWSRKWLSEPGNADLLQAVWSRIMEEGGLRAADFEYHGPKRSGWWDWKPAKRALEHLYAWGDLMIADRENFQRVYDLRQRVLPEWVDDTEPTTEERDQYWLRQGIRALGICQPAQAADYSYSKRNPAKQFAGDLLEDGELVEVNVRTVEGSVEPFVVDQTGHQLLVEAADGGAAARRTTFLSPFDNLFWARDRDSQLWDFRNMLEAYKPVSQRKWGYFCMPILHHDKLVGRIDPKIDRKNDLVIIKAIYLEEGVEPDEQLLVGIRETLRSFMVFHQAKEVQILESQPSDLGARLLGQI